MKIRPIEAKDNLQVAAIIRECLTEYGGDHRTDTAWADPYLERFSEVYVLENNAYWVAEDDSGEVVAGVGVGPIPGVEDVGELQKMYCLQPSRGTGIAHELLMLALEFAAKHYRYCYLETLENMDRAKHFYEKHGFVRTQETIGHTGHDGCTGHYIIDLLKWKSTQKGTKNMMNDMLSFIESRRSTRAYQEKPVEQDKLEQVIEAGRYAPSGGNSQSCHMLVVRDRAVMDKLAELVSSAFAAMEETPGMYSSMVNSIRRSRAGGYRFHYDAPVLIITANQMDYGNNLADCACVLENMMLMANALDLGSCWINQLKWLQNDPSLLEYLRSLGLEENERVYGALAVGYAKTEDGLPNRTPLPRKGNPVTWIG